MGDFYTFEQIMNKWHEIDGHSTSSLSTKIEELQKEIATLRDYLEDVRTERNDALRRAVRLREENTDLSRRNKALALWNDTQADIIREGKYCGKDMVALKENLAAARNALSTAKSETEAAREESNRLRASNTRLAIMCDNQTMTIRSLHKKHNEQLIEESSSLSISTANLKASINELFNYNMVLGDEIKLLNGKIKELENKNENQTQIINNACLVHDADRYLIDELNKKIEQLECDDKKEDGYVVATYPQYEDMQGCHVEWNIKLK